MIFAWTIVALCSVMMLLGSGPVYYAYGNYAVAFAKEFAAPLTVINLGFTLVGVMGNLGSAPVGMALDRWGVRRVASFGVVGTALGFWLVSLASGVWQIVILFGTLIAMADVCIGVVVTSYLVSHWFQRRRGLALGLSVLGASVAAIVFPPLTNSLIGDHGWRATFVIYAVLMIALLPAILLLARLPRDFPEAEKVTRSAQDASLPPVTVALLFRSRNFWILSFAVGVMAGVNTGTMVSLIAFASARGLTTGQGSYLLSVLGMLAVVGKVLIGMSIDRLSHDLALRLGVGCQLIGMLLLATAANFPMMLVAIAVFGLGVGAMLPVWGAAMAALYGLTGYGKALGCSRAVMTPVSMVFPLLAGALYDRTGDYRAAWISFAGMLAIAFIALFGLASARPRPALNRG